MNRFVVPPEMPRRAQYNETFTSAALPYGDLEVPDLHSDEVRRWRAVTPPPPDEVILDSSAIVSLEPFDCDDTSSVSSQGSIYTWTERAGDMLVEPKIFSGHKHPLVDCAYNVYTSALQRAAEHLSPQAKQKSGSLPVNLIDWHTVCAYVRPDFFVYRQDPPLAHSPQESRRLIAWLVDTSFLAPAPKPVQAGWGMAHKMLREDDILAKARANRFEHHMLEPFALRMAVTALNTIYDAGRFEFFEMQQIYNFQFGASDQPDVPFVDLPENTEEACKMRARGGHVKMSMVQQREGQVNEREKEVGIEIDRYTIAYQKAWANKFV